jgi:glycosyltransferase involved in cell wall biosynthesis
MKIALIFRKQKPHFFSIEKVFNTVFEEIEHQIDIEKIFLPGEKASFRCILQNLFFLFSIKASVYHITGEVYYAAYILPRKKTIVTIHDCNYALGKSFKGRLIKYLFLQIPVRRSDYVVTISEKTKEEAIQLTGCKPSKVIVINNPIDKRFTHVPRVYNVEKPVVLQVGTRWNKNFDRVATALIGITCQFKIIGALTDEQISFLKTNNIEYFNYQNLTDLQLLKQYQEADLLVFVSLSEGFGLPIVEAQAVGRPVITSNLRPMCDVAGDAAMLVDPNDISAIRTGILKIMQDDNYRKDLITRGLKNAAKYRTDIISAQYLTLYNNIINQQT